jgi:hypothetical protein
MNDYEPEDIEHMIDVESEHQPTYDWLLREVNQKKMPAPREMFKHIALNHVNEDMPRSKEYYVYLDRMEDCLKDDVPVDACFSYKKGKTTLHDWPRRSKSLTDFIKEHREEIDKLTKSQYKNDEERRLWILNDEGLYNWARSEGVRI